MNLRPMLFGAFLLAACGGDSSSHPDLSSAADLGSADQSAMCSGGPASGAADRHCYGDGGAMLISVDEAQCSASSGDPGDGDDYGATMYGTSGNDDDCKYFVSYTVTPICELSDTYFTVTVTNAIGMAPVAGAMNLRIEAQLSETHPLNTSAATTTEVSAGVYKFGPVRFDASGQWTVRFHFFETCTDTPSSPHGHAAFFVDVP